MQNNDPNYLNRYIDKISEIMNFINANRLHKLNKLSPEFEKRLFLLEGRIQLFSKMNDELIKKAGVTGQELQDTIQAAIQNHERKKKMLLPKEKRLLNRISQMKQEVEAQQQEIAHLRHDQKAGYKQKVSKNEGKKRKGKFKPLGGDQNWLPL